MKLSKTLFIAFLDDSIFYNFIQFFLLLNKFENDVYNKCEILNELENHKEEISKKKKIKQVLLTNEKPENKIIKRNKIEKNIKKILNYFIKKINNISK